MSSPSISRRMFERCPQSLKSLPSSCYGYFLRYWRYGADTERLVEATLERDYWTDEQWDTWQQNQLSYVLHRAATTVPYYREMWSRRRQSGDHSSWEYLENWPLLSKATLRANQNAFLADDCRNRRMYVETTSGTTGTALKLMCSRETLQQWYALFEARCRRWYDVSLGDRWAILGGQMVAPLARAKPPFWVWNAGLKQLYLSSYHLRKDWIPAYLDAMKRKRVQYLVGYTSAIYALARGAIDHNVTGLNLKVVISNAEPVFDYQRQTIADAFDCPVRETYGMAEYVSGASECRQGRLHLWPSAGLLKVNVDQNSPDNSGEFVCTGLLNTDFPLIRYQMGDRGSLADPDQRCECGRSLPILASIEGRCDDTLYTRDGREIGRLDPVFKSGLAIEEAQIIQERLDLIRVKYVPAKGFDLRSADELKQRLRERFGDVEIELVAVQTVPRTANGKFRAVICNLSESDRIRLVGDTHCHIPAPTSRI